MIYRKINNILQEISARTERLQLPYEDELIAQIQYLSLKEKDIIRQFIFAHEWNLGSARVLAILKQANVLRVTEYVLRLCSRESVQKVMNDLLETEHILLAELFSYSCIDTEISTTLSDILQECFSSGLDDFLENPNVISCNYLEKLGPCLCCPEMVQLRQQHLRLLLQKGSSSTLEEAVMLQEQWRSDALSYIETTFGRIILEIISDIGSSIEQLFDSANTTNIFWKHYLLLLNAASKSIGNNRMEILRVKELMKTMYNHVLVSNDFKDFLVMILTAREICAANECVFGNYSSWYKAAIGEMSYSISDEQFKQVMEKMTLLIQLEKSIDIVKTHINIAISSPPELQNFHG